MGGYEGLVCLRNHNGVEEESDIMMITVCYETVSDYDRISHKGISRRCTFFELIS